MRREQRDDLYSMLCLCGRPIGYDRVHSRAAWHFVLDGKVYRVLPPYYEDEPVLSWDYFEFCERLRAGEFPNFYRHKRFHLGEAQSPLLDEEKPPKGI
jgi:hypothetical protein